MKRASSICSGEARPDARPDARATREVTVTRVRVVPDPAHTRREEYAHTLRIGLISAAMVLLLFVAALFGLAVWLP